MRRVDYWEEAGKVVVLFRERDDGPGYRGGGKESERFSEFVGSLLVEVKNLNKLRMLDMCIKYVGVLYLWSRSTGTRCI
jgi:hypothetical protein